MIPLGLCEGSNSGYTGTNSIQIDYDDTVVEDLNMTFDKYDASPISSDHSHQTIWDIVDIPELNLSTENALESFLKATMWRSFGFFRKTWLSYRDTCDHSNVYLVALFPVEFFSDRTVHVVSADRRTPSDKSL
jgi:hypothetical protein